MTEILWARLNRNEIFLFKIQQKVKIREQDPTDIENCFTRLIQDSTETKFCFQDSK